MSVVSGKIKITNLKEMRNEMKKSRMTKAERKFFDAITALVFATPEVRNGKNYLDRKAFNVLPKDVQTKWIDLQVNKTF